MFAHKLILVIFITLVLAGCATTKDIFQLIEERDHQAVESMLKKRADPNIRNKDADPALIVALDQEDYDTAKLLLEYGANVNVSDNTDWTPLMSASNNGSIEIVQLLIEKGADVNAKNNLGMTVLMQAIEHKDIIKLLIHKGADIHALDEIGWNAFMLAVLHDQTETAELMIQNGIALNVKGKDEQTAMTAALYRGNFKIVKLLLEGGIGVNEPCKFDPKHRYGFRLLLQDPSADNYILYPGGNVKILDGRAFQCVGKRPLKTPDYHYFIDPKTYLLKRTPMMIAAYFGHMDIVEFLLNKGADVNAADDEGWTALILAALRGKIDAVKILIDHGANIDAKNIKGVTSLMWASGSSVYPRGHSDVVQFLLDAGTELNAADQDGYTALIWAAMSGNSDIVKMLLVKGADANIKDMNGNSALALANKRGHTETAELLKQFGARE